MYDVLVLLRKVEYTCIVYLLYLLECVATYLPDFDAYKVQLSPTFLPVNAIGGPVLAQSVSRACHEIHNGVQQLAHKLPVHHSAFHWCWRVRLLISLSALVE